MAHQNARMREVEKAYEALPHGQERLTAIHAAIREADASGDRTWRMRSRCDAVAEEVFHGDSGKVLPLVAQVVALFEEQPIPSETLAYLWILDVATGQWGHLPQLPLDQWEKLMQHYWDAVQLYQKYDGAYYKKIFRRAEARGQKDKMDDAWRKWLNAKHFSSCPGCNQRFRVERAVSCGDVEEAKREARPILDGTTPCDQEPEVTLGQMLELALRYGTRREAADWAKKLEVELKKETPYMDYNYAMLCWLAYSDTEEGLKMMERFLPSYWNYWSQSEKLYFLRGCWVLCSQIAQSGVPLRPLELPEEFPLWREDGRYEAKALADLFYNTAWEIAQAFTARDGYPYYEKELKDAEYFFSGGSDEAEMDEEI